MKLHATILSAIFLPLASQAATTYYLTGGHVDAPAFGYISNADATEDEPQGFEPHVHNHGGADAAIVNGSPVVDESEYEPGEITIVVPNTSTTTFNSQTYYWLPQDETDAANNGAPFAGIGLEELSAGDWVGGTLTLTLLSITGPGDIVLWQDGFPAADIFFDSAGDIRNFEAGSHTHLNWGFSAVGSYQLEFGISGEHVVDGLQSASGVYNFEVIPEPSAALLGAFASLGLLRRRR